jgi:hypothetical protein
MGPGKGPTGCFEMETKRKIPLDTAAVVQNFNSVYALPGDGKDVQALYKIIASVFITSAFNT